MYLCYIDESGDTGVRGSRHLLLGAAVLFEGQWSRVNTELGSLIHSYFPKGARPSELHCADIRMGRDEYSKLAKEDRFSLLTDFASLATSMLDIEFRLLTVAYDKTWWSSRNPSKTGKDLYLEAFENLVGRFDLFLRRMHAEGRSSKGIVIIDPHSTSLTAALKSALVSYQQGGTRWAKLYNVIESAMFLASHESPGLQLADLCAYAIWRLIEHGDGFLASQVARAFDREPMTSTQNPGKWHGVKYYGDDPQIVRSIDSLWP